MEIDQLSKKLTQLEEENRRLRIGIEELSILNEISIAISSTLSLERVIDLIIHKCIKHLHVEQGAVMLLDKHDPGKPFHTMVRKADDSSKFLPYRMDTQLTGWMLKNRQPLLVNDLKNDSRFIKPKDVDLPVQSLLSVPLILKGEMIGLLTAFNKKHVSGFTTEDQRLLSIIASQSTQVIENARLYEEEQNLFRIQEEMRLATEIQKILLPKDYPHFEGYDIAGQSIPAKDVGGDYYDFIKVDESRLAICLGDVSGKGMPAALLMSNLQATLRGQTMMLESGPKECIGRSNQLIFRSTDLDKFATLFYGIIDNKSNHLIYTNAGHDIPFLLRGDRECSRLTTGGIVVGFVEKYSYDQDRVSFNTGDLLLLYSDGLTEAMNVDEEEFGEQRLYEVVQKNRDLSAAELIQVIMKNVFDFSSESTQMDDMTVVVVKRTG